MEEIKEVDVSIEWVAVFNTLPELQKRWFAAVKALELGHGGISKINRVTGLSRMTITKGVQEVEGKEVLSLADESRNRERGGGRKKIEVHNPKILAALESILDETSAGDPMSLLRWTCKSSRLIAGELKKQGFKIEYKKVQKMIKDQGYSLQSNKKMLSSKNHPDRSSQFKNINRTVNRFIKSGNPVISVDTKKKELIGNFKNMGRVWSKKGEAKKVLDHDFKSYSKGIAIPYGAYDVKRNEGFINVGMTSDTSQFAVNSIWQWWRHFGIKCYKNANEILICADGGGSNSNRSRSWKFYLQEFCNKTGLSVTVCHYPPGTSKWNKIEHRMFSFISLNWKGQPLENYESVVKLISATKTKKGLKVRARLDKVKYKKGQKVSDEDFNNLCIKFHNKFPSWNYTIDPLI